MANILLLAILIDLFIGDPSNRWHPVAWMGSLIMRGRKNAPQSGKFIYGGFVSVGGALCVYSITLLLTHLLNLLPAPLNTAIQAYILKTTFSIRGLEQAALEVETALYAHDLPEARRSLSWHLVSRDTSTLDASQVSAAAIESVAENTSDGVIAPLFWYSIGGLPFAMAYRYLQTCDSILGYRDEEREWLGKIPARVDDVINLIPARLTAISFLAFKPSTWRVWQTSAQVTASPNAGHPMSAMAGVLEVELEKVDHYTLHPEGSAPKLEDIKRARHIMLGAVGLFSVVLFVILKVCRD